MPDSTDCSPGSRLVVSCSLPTSRSQRGVKTRKGKACMPASRIFAARNKIGGLLHAPHDAAVEICPLVSESFFICSLLGLVECSYGRSQSNPEAEHMDGEWGMVKSRIVENSQEPNHCLAAWERKWLARDAISDRRPRPQNMSES